MAVFAVIARTNAAGVKAAVTKHYGENHYEFSSNTWFIPDNGSTKDVADKLGITKGQLAAESVVVALPAYSGWGPATAWQWLAKQPDATANG